MVVPVLIDNLATSTLLKLRKILNVLLLVRTYRRTLTRPPRANPIFIRPGTRPPFLTRNPRIGKEILATDGTPQQQNGKWEVDVVTGPKKFTSLLIELGPKK